MPSRKPSSRRRKTVKPASDKFIVGMVVPTKTGSRLRMLPEPHVFSSYAAAVTHANEKYEKYPTAKWVVFAKVCTIGAPFLAPKIEEWSF